MARHSGSMHLTTFLAVAARRLRTRGSAVRTRLPYAATLLLASDLGALALAGALASWTTAATAGATAATEGQDLSLLALVFPLCHGLLGLYPGVGVSPVDELRRLSLGTTGVVGVATLAVSLQGGANPTFLTFAATAWCAALFLLPLARAALRHLFAGRPWWGARAVVLGGGRTAELLIERTRANPGLHLKVVAVYDDDPDKQGRSLGNVPVAGGLSDAGGARDHWGAHLALVAMPGVEPATLTRLVERHGHSFPQLIFVPNLFGIGSIGVGGRDLGGIVALDTRQNLLLPGHRLAKRVLDLILLIPLAPLALPLIALAALAVAIVSPGNPFYAQSREGRYGRPIRVWKLRTMWKDAESLLHKHFEENPAARAEWERHYKLEHDPRILPAVGPLLRRLSIDELPQLVNVLKGEMSFVGPRPFPAYHLDHFGEEFRVQRRRVLPGLTGIWQVSARSTASLEAQEQLDAYYILNWSIWMDLYVLARTPWAVLFGEGAY